MKKSLIAAAVAATGLAVFGESIESQNMVGYQRVTLAANKQAIASGFFQIGSEGFKLSELVPTDYGEKCTGSIVIERLDAFGVTSEYWAYHAGETSGKFKNKTGWFTSNNNSSLVTSENDVTFEQGEGLWVTGLANAKFTFAGQVPTGNFTFTLAANKQMLGNPYPTAIKLTSIQPANYGDKCTGSIIIERLDAFGVTSEYWTYHAGETSGKFKNKTGWFTSNNNSSQVTSENDVTFSAGEALWVTGVNNATLTITAPAGLE